MGSIQTPVACWCEKTPIDPITILKDAMKNIAAAFVKAQRGFAPALKTSTNPHFKSKYASLDACIEAVIDSLNENGIALLQPTHETENGVTVETLFLHESGETLTGGKLHVPAAKQDPQGYGSALTYARRYSLMAACGIAPEDDDGNGASEAMKKQHEQREYASFQNAMKAIQNAETIADIGSHLKAGVALLPARKNELQAAATKRKTEIEGAAE